MFKKQFGKYRKTLLKQVGLAIGVLIVVSIALPLSSRPVLAFPQPPHLFFGEVRIGSRPASETPDNLQVGAKIGGVTYATTNTSGGKYGYSPAFAVPADDPETSRSEGGVDGQTVNFYVEGVLAGTASFKSIGVTRLDLAISALPTLAAPTNVQRTTPTNDNTPTFTWNAVTNAVSYEVRVDTASWNNIGNVTTYTFATILDGSHTFEVRGVDATANPGPSGSLLFTIDTTPPVVTITPLTPDPTTDNTPTFTGTATDVTTTIASVEYRVDGGSWIVATASDGAFDEASEIYTFTTSTLDDGSHTVQVRATDAAGNITPVANYASDTFTVTTVPPVLPAPTNLQLTTPINDNTPTFTWNAVTNAVSYEVRVDTASWVNIGNVTTYTFATILDGSHTFQVKGVNATGNPGLSGSHLFTIDTTPPTVTITALTPDPTTDNTPTFTGTATDVTTTIASVEYRVDGGSWIVATASDGAFDEASEIYTFTTSTLATVLHTVEVRATDAAGNVIIAANYASDTFTVTTAAPSPGPPPGPPPSPPTVPTAEKIEAMTTAEAVKAIEALTAEKAAEIMGQVTTAKAADIIEEVTTVKAAEILGQVTTAKAVEIIGQVTTAKAAEIMGQVTTAKAAEIMGQVTTAKAVEILGQVTTAKAASIMEQLTTAKAAEIMGQLTTAKAAEILGQVTTAKAASIMEQLTTAKAAEIMGQLTTAKAAEIIGQVTTAKAVGIMEQLTTAKAAEIIGQLTTAKAASIIEQVTINKAAAIMEQLTTEKLTQVIPGVSEKALMERLPGLSTAKLYSIEPAVLFNALPNAPTEQLVSEDPPQPPPELEAPIAVYTTPSGAQYLAIRTIAGEWAIVMGTPMPVDKLLIKTRQALENVRTTLEVLAEPPTEVTVELPAEQIALAYLNISFENALPEDIELGHMTFKVEKEWLEQNSIHKWSVVLNRYDPELKQWIPLPTKRVAEDDSYVYYSVVITHFSTFAISGSQTVPALAFKATNLIINPTEVESGQEVTISADITNLSDIAGTFVVTLWIDATIEDGKNIFLEAGETKPVAFTVTRDTEGSYQVRLDRLFGRFSTTKVTKPPAEPVQPPVEPVQPPVELPVVPAKPINWGLIIGIIAGVIVIGVVIWLVIRRRRA